jgi:mannan endo-1,4-beta-mannosidase
MQPIARRTLLRLMTALGLVTAAPALAKAKSKSKPARTSPAKADFVATDGTRFTLNGKTYRYVGANIWYGAYLGAPAAFGDRARLVKELDDLKALGVVNLRVLASSELSPLKNSLDPAFTRKPGDYNPDLLAGLDFLLAEMHKRDMKAVLYLTNFWEWSGGMVAYQAWTNGGNYINNGDPAHPWPEYPDFSAQFYSNSAAKALYAAYVKMLLKRTNAITGKPYSDDPTIMAWQLCNEPRPGGSEAAVKTNTEAYLAWIKDTAALIRSLDGNHLVSLGQEGLAGVNGDPDLVLKAHEHIDYITAHIWPQNWSWIDPKDIAGTYDSAATKVTAYIDAHIDLAKKLDKPLVFEEFGFPRDGVAYAPGTPTTYKDRFYGLIYAAVENAVRNHTPVAGSNFWAWGGSGRARHDDFHMLRGETDYVGDPPHEPQGWYSVFNTDTSTQALIKAHAERIKALSAS